LLDIREHGWDGVINAADRTEAHCDHCGDKSSQAELYNCWQAGNPDCAPANPPGTGTHEGVNDGTAYPDEPRGSKLEGWQWGLDLSDEEGAAAAFADCGYHARRPYPNESWHFNLTENPRERLIKRGRV
jgi:hypothetical protein